jgi:hypothetical protein
MAAAALIFSGRPDLQVKEVVRKAKPARGNTRRSRYIVCSNDAEARNDAAARAATLAGLEKALRQGEKAPAGNKGFRQFLRTEGNSHFAIDPERAGGRSLADRQRCDVGAPPTCRQR